MHDNTAEEIQRKYDYFCDTFTSRIKKVQVDIEQIKDRSKNVDRSGKRIEELLTEVSGLLNETVKSTVGYLIQTKEATIDKSFAEEDLARTQRELLPKGKTYCCVMKRAGLSRKEDIEGKGLKEKDLSLLFRLIPCVGYETGILVNDIGIPFSSVNEIAEYLGEKKGADSTTGQAIRRLKEAGIIYKYCGVFIIDDSYIRCGQMTRGVLQKRRKVLKDQLDKQGKKGGVKQGKKQTRTKKEKSIKDKPQTQAGSEQEKDIKIPF